MADSTLGILLAEQARIGPEASAIEEARRSPLTYAQLIEQMDRTRRSLRSFGIGRQDRVALLLTEGADAAVAFLSIATAAVVAPLIPAYRPSRVAFYLQQLAVRALVVPGGAYRETADAARACGVMVIELVSSDDRAGTFELRCDPHHSPVPDSAPATPADLALLMHTSGTTGQPKVVPLTHANICASVRNNIAALALGPLDRSLVLMPLFHVGGVIRAVVSSLAAGGTAICTPGFQAHRFLDWLREHRPTWYTASPAIQQMILAQAVGGATFVPSTLRMIRAGAAPTPPTLLQDLERVFGVPVITGYGMTEAAGHIVSNPLPPDVRKLGSVGKPTEPRVAVLGADCRELGPRQVGEIVVRGESVMKGYERNPEANAAAFVNEWLRTGDQGYLDEDGYLYITGRLKEIINRGGEKISPRQVDDVLLAHPAVAQAVTFALPDAGLGETVAAAVVVKPGVHVTARELREFVADRLAFFKVPHRIVFLPDLPKGPSGKIQRIDLAERLGLTGEDCPTGRDEVAYSAPRTPLEQELARLWVGVLRVPRIGVDDDFFELGGNSMTAVQAIFEIQQRFGAELRADILFRMPTIAQLARTIEECLKTKPGQTLARRVRPMTVTERRLLAIWEDLLDVRPIELHDSFFDVGGRPQDVTRLYAEIRAVFGEGLSTRTLDETPTIEGLARTIDGTEADSGLLVPLRTSASRPPLFAVHAGAGYVFFYRALASRLGADFSFYAIQAQGHVGGNQRPYAPARSLEQLASCYVREIRTVQPHGPYNLAGASFGGIIAFEMARQLHAQGEVVDTLFLFSPHILNNPHAEDGRRTTTHQARPLLRRIWTHLVRFGLLDTASEAQRHLTVRVGGRLKARIGRLRIESSWRWRTLWRQPIPAELINARFMAASRALRARYQPGEYDGPAVLFRAATDEDPVPLWTGLTHGGLEVYDTPGGHLEMLEEPTVARVADIIRAHTRRAPRVAC